MSDRHRPDPQRPSGSLLSLASDGAARRRETGEPAAESVRPQIVPAEQGLATLTQADAEWRPLIDPRAVFAGIAGSRRLIAAATIAGALLGVIIALMTPKHYQASSDLLIDPRDIRLVERELVSSNLSMEAALAIIENQVRLVTSTKVLDRVVAELDLVRDPEFNGSGGGFTPRALLSGLRGLLGGGGSGAARRIEAQTAANLLRKLDVSRGGKNFVVTVAARSEDPEKAAEIANKVVDAYRSEAQKLAADTVGRAADELTARLGQLRASLEEAERKVERYKAEQDLVDARGHLIADDEIVALNQQLAEARNRTIEARARVTALGSTDADAVASGGLPEGVNSPVITELRAQYGVLSREASRLAATVGPRHPQRRSIDTQLAEARSEIRAELSRIAASLQVDLRRAVEQEQKLAARLSELKARQANAGEALVTLRELERDAAAQRAVYEAFLLRARETTEQQGLNTANISVISRAEPPLVVSGPSRALIAIAGLLLGLCAGIGLGGLRGVLPTIRGEVAPGARTRPQVRLRATEKPATPRPEPESLRADPIDVDDEADPYHDIRENIREVRRALYELAEQRERREF